MSSDKYPTVPESEQMPTFSSNIPEFLIDDKTPASLRWLIENQSVMSQEIKWLAREQHKQSRVLGQVVELQKQTNGRVLKAEGKIEQHDKIVSEIATDSDVKAIHDMKVHLKPLNALKTFSENRLGRVILLLAFSSVFFFFNYLYDNIGVVPKILGKIVALVFGGG